MTQRKWGLLALAVAVGACAFVSADGDKPADATGVVVDKDKRTVTIDAKVAPRKIDDPRYDKIYPLEVVACWAFPKGQKAHETVVTIDCKPSDVPPLDTAPLRRHLPVTLTRPPPWPCGSRSPAFLVGNAPRWCCATTATTRWPSRPS